MIMMNRKVVNKQNGNHHALQVFSVRFFFNQWASEVQTKSQPDTGIEFSNWKILPHPTLLRKAQLASTWIIMKHSS